MANEFNLGGNILGSVNFGNIVPQIINSLLEAGEFVFVVVLSLFIGYALGYILASIFRRLFKTQSLEKHLVRYGAVTSSLWESIINFLSEYLKWLIALMTLDAFLLMYGKYDIIFVSQLSAFLLRLLALVVSTIVGILLGGVVYKIIKDFLISVGLERELGKHHLAESMAGFSVSSIVAFIVKWYIVLLFLTTGLQIFKPVIFIDADTRIVLLAGLEDLADYVPQAILGFLILLASVIISDFVSEHVRLRRVSFSELYSLFLEVLIIAIGVLLALPHFGVKNTYFLEYSFIILVAGISLGVAIALGFSLRDRIKKELG
ncbi:MAG: hypothetical protein B6U72_01605 [Candidatus Altiarchaeales archaeon ex4484_2]|nr:MAG: hypothetical protein B6U72_01605 [Candidatus Altiarchaeales archaeon ex4484_2]